MLRGPFCSLRVRPVSAITHAARGLEPGTIVHPSVLKSTPVPGTPTYYSMTAAERAAIKAANERKDAVTKSDAAASGSASGTAGGEGRSGEAHDAGRSPRTDPAPGGVPPEQLHAAMEEAIPLTPRGRRQGQPRAFGARAATSSSLPRAQTPGEFVSAMGHTHTEGHARPAAVKKSTPLIEAPKNEARSPQHIPRPRDGDFAGSATRLMKSEQQAESDAKAVEANRNRMMAMGNRNQGDPRSRVDQLSGWRGVDGKMGDAGHLGSIAQMGGEVVKEDDTDWRSYEKEAESMFKRAEKERAPDAHRFVAGRSTRRLSLRVAKPEPGTKAPPSQPPSQPPCSQPPSQPPPPRRCSPRCRRSRSRR